MRTLTPMQIVAGDRGEPDERVLLHRDCWVVEPELKDGEPTGRLIFGAWAKNGIHEFVLVEPPKVDPS